LIPAKGVQQEQLNILMNGDQQKRIQISDSRGHSVRIRTVSRGKRIILDYYCNQTSEYISNWAESFMTSNVCETCGGGKLKNTSLKVLIDSTQGKKNIFDISQLSIKDARSFFDELKLHERQQIIARQILKEIKMRLEFMLNVGLDYLTLDRSARTLSGGEAQRIKACHADRLSAARCAVYSR
jgi:excinuclease ABC subunit A